MKGIVRQVFEGRVVIESRDGDILNFEPHGNDGFWPDDLLAWTDGPEIFNWTQNTRIAGRWVAGE